MIKPNTTIIKIWVSIISFCAGLLLLPMYSSLPILFSIASAVQTVLGLPGSVLSSVISPAGDIASNFVMLFSLYLNFFIVGLVISLLLYRKYGKIVYWSLFFTIPTFLLSVGSSLFSDTTAIDFVLPFPLVRILYAISAPLGYYLGLYVGSKSNK